MTMPAYSFQLQVDLDTVQLQLTMHTLQGRLGIGLENWMENDLATYLQRRAADRFASGGDDASGPWAPLQPTTQAIRAAHGFPPAHPINIRTHDLYNYITGDMGTVRNTGAWVLDWPNLPPDAETQDKLQTTQRGRPTPYTTDRPVVALGVDDYQDILDDLAAFLMDGLM